jgi:Flp pilus assembly protein TadG
MPSSPRAARHATKVVTRHPETGAAAVEFALVLIPLLLLILGTIDWGYYFYVREIVADAARAGARAGSLDPASASTTATNTATAFLTNLNLTGATFPGCTGTVPANSVCIRIDYPTPSITGFTKLGGVMPPTASAQAAMRLEP